VIGLYAIVHKTKRTAYVGSSNNIARRIKEHKTDLKYNKHHCQHLQRAWNKYGSDAFEIKQIASANSLKYARELEEAFFRVLYK